VRVVWVVIETFPAHYRVAYTEERQAFELAAAEAALSGRAGLARDGRPARRRADRTPTQEEVVDDCVTAHAACRKT